MTLSNISVYSSVIWATRNRIAHGYAYTELAMIRDTVEQDLPSFERKLRSSVG